MRLLASPSSARVVLGLLALLFLAGWALADQRCAACGTGNSDDAQFCKNCGARLESRPATEPRAARLTASVIVKPDGVEIASEPSGAKVEVDGVVRGTTPLELRDLAAGRHEYRVTLRGYRTQTGSFTTTSLTGSVVVTTEPAGAQVYLDGALMGQAEEGGLPLLRVSYGRHSIKARLEGYNDVTKVIDLKTPGPYAVTLRLGWGKGFLSVRSEPDSAKLTVESRSAGTTPYFAEFAPSRYVLSLAKRGYADWIGYAEVYQAETTNVRVTLEKLKTRKWPFVVAGAVGFVAGGVSAYMGEQSYARYQGATSADSARHYRQVTERWDLMRNVALGGGAAFSVTWILVKW